MIAKTLYELWLHPERYNLTDTERAFVQARSKSITAKHGDRFKGGLAELFQYVDAKLRRKASE